MFNKIKYYYKLLNLYWDIKQISGVMVIATIGLVFATYTLRDLFPLLLLVTLWSTSSFTILHSWFTRIKPAIKEVEKEIKLEEKYSFMIKRFTK
ncbi:hypothetical protein CHH83_02055 [Bacillus sp. 7586-K]|nr:hypothetical protein CHH83_02055 [Bacillus sp. 7586-K]